MSSVAIVPDYIPSDSEGAFYGWPYSYFGQHVDARVAPPRPDLVASATVPDFAVGTHTGSLGLAFSNGARMLPQCAEGALVGQYGSWNRQPPIGYRVIFVPFANGRAIGPSRGADQFPRPRRAGAGPSVGVASSLRRALVADDVGGLIWRVTQGTSLKNARCRLSVDPGRSGAA
jgi:glucose/arabinose dehydrogenase